MKLFTNKKQLQKEIRKFNNISFVPTMGALHKGHESIIRKSVKRSGKTLVSIFVNPKQFNNKKDLDTYPKNNRNDLELLKSLNIHYLYKPSYDDIYKFKTKNKIHLDKFSRDLVTFSILPSIVADPEFPPLLGLLIGLGSGLISSSFPIQFSFSCNFC